MKILQFCKIFIETALINHNVWQSFRIYIFWEIAVDFVQNKIN